MTGLTRTPIDHHALVDAVRSPRCGAVVLFLGTVRELTGGHVTVFLDYEAYGPMAERKLAEIEADVRRRWGAVTLRSYTGSVGWRSVR